MVFVYVTVVFPWPVHVKEQVSQQSPKAFLGHAYVAESFMDMTKVINMCQYIHLVYFDFLVDLNSA